MAAKKPTDSRCSMPRCSKSRPLKPQSHPVTYVRPPFVEGMDRPAYSAEIKSRSNSQKPLSREATPTSQRPLTPLGEAASRQRTIKLVSRPQSKIIIKRPGPKYKPKTEAKKPKPASRMAWSTAPVRAPARNSTIKIDIGARRAGNILCALSCSDMQANVPAITHTARDLDGAGDLMFFSQSLFSHSS